MLKKLLKYDFKNQFKLAVPLYILLAAASAISFVLAVVISALFNADTEASIMVSFGITSVLIFYFLMIFAIIVAFSVSSFIPVFHFYKHLFSDEGYLTLTLPIKMRDQLISKTISGFVVNLTSTVVGALSVIVSIGISALYVIKNTIDETVFASIKEMLFYAFEGTSNAWSAMLVLYAVYFVVALFYGLMVMYMCVTLGAVVFKKLKIVGAIIFYFATSLVSGVIETGLGLIIGIIAGISDNADLATNFSVISTTVVYAIIGVVVFFVNRHLFEKKLNLE